MRPYRHGRLYFPCYFYPLRIKANSEVSIILLTLAHYYWLYTVFYEKDLLITMGS